MNISEYNLRISTLEEVFNEIGKQEEAKDDEIDEDENENKIEEAKEYIFKDMSEWEIRGMVLERTIKMSCE